LKGQTSPIRLEPNNSKTAWDAI